MFHRLFLALPLLLFGYASAQAGPIEAVFDFDGAGKGVTVNFNGHDESVFAGQFRMHLNNNPGTGPNFWTFCVDFTHDMTSEYKVNIRSTSDGLNAGAKLAYLYNTYGQFKITSDNAAAGLQLAIWDLVVDGGDGLNHGSFKYTHTGTVLDLANLYLSRANTQPGQEASWLDASANGNATHRGQSVLMRTPAPAPEPGTAILLVMGCVGLVGFRRRHHG